MCNFLKPDESWWGLLKLMIHQPCFFLHRESCIIWGFKYLIWRYLIRLFRGWGFPYIRLTYCLDRLFYLHLIIGWITWRYPPIFYGCISFKATSLIYKKNSHGSDLQPGHIVLVQLGHSWHRFLKCMTCNIISYTSILANVWLVIIGVWCDCRNSA